MGYMYVIPICELIVNRLKYYMDWGMLGKDGRLNLFGGVREWSLLRQLFYK